VHRSQPQIANRIRLLELPAEVQEMIRDGRLSPSHGVALVRYARFPDLCFYLADAAVKRPLTSKDLERDPAHLVHYGSSLVRHMYAARFDRAVCQSCPYDAYRASGICLKPDHFDELNRQVDEQRAKERQAALTAAIAAGQTIPTAAEIRRDHYEFIGTNPPPGCTEQCPCRSLLQDSSGELRPACMNPTRFHELRQAEWAEKEAKRKSRKAEILGRLEQRLPTLSDVGPRELVILATRILRYEQSKQVKAAFKRHKAAIPNEATSSPCT
jgi:ParB-like chromosome segregation protein Spo0J